MVDGFSRPNTKQARSGQGWKRTSGSSTKRRITEAGHAGLAVLTAHQGHVSRAAWHHGTQDRPILAATSSIKRCTTPSRRPSRLEHTLGNRDLIPD